MEPTIARQPESVQTNQSMTPTDTPIEALEERGATVGMPLFLQRSGTSQTVQREDSLPPVPNFQLTPPSLLQPSDPASRYSLGLNYHLDLDPQLTIPQITQQLLDPAILKLQLTQLDLTVPSFTPERPRAEATPTAVPSEPSATRSATAGDLLKGVVKVPAIDRTLTTLQTRVSDRAEADWRHLKLGEKVGVISAFTVIGAGTLAGIISNPEARRFSLGQLNGQVLPVPKVDWLHLEINTQGNNLMLGFHLDVGQLLPSVLGFRASSPNAIGVPQPALVSGQRTIQRAANHTNETTQDSIGQRIQSASGGGDSLDAGIQQHLEQNLGSDLSSVQIHTNREADRLSRSVNAIAFTTGQDIFFSAGSYNPRSSEGQQLIAHEVVHTVQQANGAVAGTPTADGVSVSDPADSFEQEADRVAQQVTTLPHSDRRETAISQQLAPVVSSTGSSIHLSRKAVAFFRDSDKDWFASDMNHWAADMGRLSTTKNTFVKAAIFNTQNNNPEEYVTISQRSAYYDVVDALAAEGILPKKVRFFGAAAKVTNSNSVGSIEGLTGWSLHSKEAIKILKDVNKILFDANIKVINRLMSRGKPTDPKQPDSTDALSPMQFDLNMVDVEQSIVETYLKGKTANLTDEAIKDINDDLNFKGLIRTIGENTVASPQPLNWAKAALGKDTLDFMQKADRVAIGKALVFSLHANTFDEYKAYITSNATPVDHLKDDYRNAFSMGIDPK
jgi:hypothetical protein